jgi:hypothetical protein
MSVARKTVLAVAILGAGLASTAGVATATTAHHGGGCSNDVAAKSSNSSGDSLGDTTGGAQDLSAENVCDIFNGNTVGSDNNTALLGNIVNGDTTTRTTDITSTTSSSRTTG